MSVNRLAMFLSIAVVLLLAVDSAYAQQHLAVLSGKTVIIVDAETGKSVHVIKANSNIGKVAYRPDGKRLAVGMCGPARIVEFETSGYREVATHVIKGGCGLAHVYSPDSKSLAAIFPKLARSESGAPADRLWIRGPQPLNRELGTGSTLPARLLLTPLPPALTYHPGGGELAISTPQGFTVLSTKKGYPELASVRDVKVLSLAYTSDGARLLVGTSSGFRAYSAEASYKLTVKEEDGAVIDIAVASSGGWVAIVREKYVSVRSAADLSEIKKIKGDAGLRDVDFSSDGSYLAMADGKDVRRIQLASWRDLGRLMAVPRNQRIDAAVLQALNARQIPVLFVHGHNGNSNAAWQTATDEPSSTSFAAVLAVNPQLHIDPFYLDLPLDDDNRSIVDDARDIKAMIEGGLDSRGQEKVGILKMPAYRNFGLGRVAIISYSQGALSSRYYIKNLMQNSVSGTIPVSEFITLAAPNHGISEPLVCRQSFLFPPNRATRELCVGRVASDDCICPPPTGPPCTCSPALLSNNSSNNAQAPEALFLSELNGHPLLHTCTDSVSFPDEAPFSRPTLFRGILYVNLFGTGDTLVGDDNQSGDCFGRRRARNLAEDVDNRQINGIPSGRPTGSPLSTVHGNVPHHREVICIALNTVVNRAAPSDEATCTLPTWP